MPNTLLTTSTKDLKDAFTFNVATAHALTIAAVPLMLEHSGGGSIINITSTMGRLAGRGFAAYGTAKAALVALHAAGRAGPVPADPGQRDRARDRS